MSEEATQHGYAETKEIGLNSTVRENVVEPFPEPNVTQKGDVYNIPIGPFMLFYRYGLFGLFLYFPLFRVFAVD